MDISLSDTLLRRHYLCSSLQSLCICREVAGSNNLSPQFGLYATLCRGVSGILQLLFTEDLMRYTLSSFTDPSTQPPPPHTGLILPQRAFRVRRHATAPFEFADAAPLPTTTISLLLELMKLSPASLFMYTSGFLFATVSFSTNFPSAIKIDGPRTTTLSPWFLRFCANNTSRRSRRRVREGFSSSGFLIDISLLPLSRIE